MLDIKELAPEMPIPINDGVEILGSATIPEPGKMYQVPKGVDLRKMSIPMAEPPLTPDAIFTPVGWRILVKPPKAAEKTKGGIFLPGSAKDADEVLMNKGQVIAIGPDAFKGKPFLTFYYDARENYVAEDLADPWVEVGDWVIYNRHTGLKLEVRNEDGTTDKYHVINDTDIVCKVANPNAVKSYVFVGALLDGYEG